MVKMAIMIRKLTVGIRGQMEQTGMGQTVSMENLSKLMAKLYLLEAVAERQAA